MAKQSGDHCSLCGRARKDVNLLIEGLEGCICDSCSLQAADIVKENVKDLKSSVGDKLITAQDIPTPKLIKERLDEYVIGQESAKKFLRWEESRGGKECKAWGRGGRWRDE